MMMNNAYLNNMFGGASYEQLRPRSDFEKYINGHTLVIILKDGSDIKLGYKDTTMRNFMFNVFKEYQLRTKRDYNSKRDIIQTMHPKIFDRMESAANHNYDNQHMDSDSGIITGWTFDGNGYNNYKEIKLDNIEYIKPENYI